MPRAHARGPHRPGQTSLQQGINLGVPGAAPLLQLRDDVLEAHLREAQGLAPGALGPAVEPVDVDLEQGADGEPPHGGLEGDVFVLAGRGAHVLVRAEVAPHAAVVGQREVYLAALADGAGRLDLDHVEDAAVGVYDGWE